MSVIRPIVLAALALGLLAGAPRSHAAPDAPAAAAAVTVGDLEITAPFLRATLPNQPVAGGFLTVTNTGEADDTLLSAGSEAAARVELHEMAMQGDVMRMRALEAGLPIPAGKTVALAPGGTHIMLMDLAGPLAEGEEIAVTLRFETAGEVTVTMPVLAPNGVPGDDHSSNM